MEDWQTDVMMFFQGRQAAERAARQAGNVQRREAVTWLRSVVSPAFDAVLGTMHCGGRTVRPKVNLIEQGNSNGVFPVVLDGKSEFTYTVDTVIDPEGLKARVTANGGTSRYMEPTCVSEISIEDLRDDLIATYKASLPSIPAVI